MTRERAVVRRHRDGLHQWVEAPLHLVARSGVADRISPFSMMDVSRVFLETDVDAPLVLQALREAGFVLEETPAVDGFSPAGRCGRYDPHFVRHPLVDGAVVALGDGRQAAVRFVEGNLIVRAEDGAIHQIADPSRFTEYLQEPDGDAPTAELRREGQVFYERRYVHDVDPGLEQAIECVVQARRVEGSVGVWKAYEEPGGESAEVFLGWCHGGEPEARTMVDVMAEGKPSTVAEFYAGAGGQAPEMEHTVEPEADDDAAMEP